MSGAVLLDTDVFSFLAKRDTRGAWYASKLGTSERVISFMTVGELRAWAILRRWSDARRANLEALIASHLVLIPDDRTTTVWAEIHSERRRKGQPIECGDCWIAATAVRHGLVLATHNRGHYEGVAGLSLMTDG